MKNIIIGTLAHVDAGKTTLSESMLYLSGSIRKVGRVDHKDTFLDYDEQERKRGITIYAKEARFLWKDTQITLIDTPGHVDFSTEMERTLQILDYAVLIINALDGIQVHTETIWNLLKHYRVPTFLFINKMDITHFEKPHLMKEIEAKLSVNCVDFNQDEKACLEHISLCDDSLLETYLETGTIVLSTIQEAILKRQLFPCYFGSALKMEGIETFLDGMIQYASAKKYSSTFGAKVYKISRDAIGNKLTHMKITGGSLKTKAKLNEREKVDQLRLYSGNKYQIIPEVSAGQVCAVKGLQHIIAGEGLGNEESSLNAVLSSYLNYKVILPKGCDILSMYRNLQLLSEEDPQLSVRFHETTQEITIQLMGEIQIEVLKHSIKERFDVEVAFDQGSVIYKETIVKAIEGVGHYEPLRHYAEVHLLLEPLKRNSGLIFCTDCSEDILPRQWQRLILTHLQEKEHIGVLTGAPITDMRITLLAGKAHLKHTEGGDFRQATYRAIRQGLKSSVCILLEPYYEFRLELPSDYLSRAMYDLEMRNATFELRTENNQKIIIIGSAPVSRMQNYQMELHAFSKGQGKLFCTLKGYEECLDSEAIIKKVHYDSERDIEHPTGSIFCAHGAGYLVPWNEVKKHMHINACWQELQEEHKPPKKVKKVHIDDEEVERVMRRTYGELKPRLRDKKIELNRELVQIHQQKPLCFLIDGYNIIHDWPNLKELAKENLDAARNQLIHYMSSFQGYKKCLLILVFDAYKVEQGIQNEYDNGSIHIIYTKQAETADSFIEKTTHELAEKYRITVATSDGLEQLIVRAQGAQRMSARELWNELHYMNTLSTREYEERQSKVGNRMLEDLRKLNE